MEDHVPITADLGYLYLGVLLFEWVLIFKNLVAIVDGYLYLWGTCI